MSCTTLKYHNITVSFLPTRRDRRVSNGLRFVRLLTSSRHLKQILRSFISR